MTENNNENENVIENNVVDLGEPDVNDLFVNTSKQHSITINHKGHDWVFKYRPLTWREKYECMENSYAFHEFVDKNGEKKEEYRTMATNYYILCLTKMLTETPLPAVSATVLGLLDIDFMDKLIEICPLMYGSATEAEEEIKKE